MTLDEMKAIVLAEGCGFKTESEFAVIERGRFRGQFRLDALDEVSAENVAHICRHHLPAA